MKIIKDPKNDPTMITSLLVFKRKIDKILKSCFNDDVTFVNALKESFEYFINTRGNKPAELLAKHLDSKLKIPVKVRHLLRVLRGSLTHDWLCRNNVFRKLWTLSAWI